jgi:4-hydroxy-tetrahydrodipicolinate synthase
MTFINLPRVLTAIVTPFDTHNEIDMDSFIELTRLQLLHNCGVVLFGTTGECPTVSENERIDVYTNIIKNFNENKFVIGVGGNNTKECINQIDLAKVYGFTTFMLTVPYYNKPTQLGLEKHFTTICNLYPSNKFILYNVPSRCGVNMLPLTVKNIIENTTNVIAIKEASGDLSQMIMIRRLCPTLNVYCGDDGLIVPAMSIGAYGLISVVSNYCPKYVDLIINRCIENNYSGAFDLYSEIDDIIRLLFSETSPSPIKYLLKSSGLINNDNVRLPLVNMQSEENKYKLLICIDKLTTFSITYSIKS